MSNDRWGKFLENLPEYSQASSAHNFRFERIDLKLWMESIYQEFGDLYPNPIHFENAGESIVGLFDPEALRLTVSGLFARVMGAIGIRKEISLHLHHEKDRLQIKIGSKHAQVMHLNGDIEEVVIANELVRAHDGELRVMDEDDFKGYCLQLKKILKV